MNLSGKGAISGDQKLSTTRITTLNPNAAEFVPSSIKSPSGITALELSSKLASSASTALGKSALDRTQSFVSNSSDEEAREYWHHQLPDDITPDFKDTRDGDFLGIDNLSLSNLSVNGNGNGNGNSLDQKFRYPVSSYGDDLPLASLRHYSSKPIEKQILISKMRNAAPYYQKSRNGVVTGAMSRQQYLEITDVNPLELLASRFPAFTVESLAEAYFSNGCNLNLTIEMLKQHEADGGLNKNVNSNSFLSPVHTPRDFPALFTEADQNLQQNVGPYHSSDKSNLLLFKPGNSIPSGEAIGFSSALRAQGTGLWKYESNESNRSVNANNVGSSRSSHILASSYQSGHVKGMLADRFQSHRSSQAVPACLETGETVGNMYTEKREEEARDHAHLRNSYIEQERRAYLAKDLSANYQLGLHHLHMKAAHGKSPDSINRQRNQVNLEIQSNGTGRVPERTIDLIGMHIGEALHVLKHELSVLRNAARSVDELVHVYICVGSGHLNLGSYTPSRLPIAVQRFLSDEEGLDYSEPQPGVFRVGVY